MIDWEKNISGVKDWLELAIGFALLAFCTITAIGLAIVFVGFITRYAIG